MRDWSLAYGANVVNFVCVCVDSQPERTAREFHRLYFDGSPVINGFIDRNEDFPKFQAQLGCQGLVVLDAAGRFATQRSPAFLDRRGAAFRAVETMLTPLIAAAAAAAPPHDRRAGDRSLTSRSPPSDIKAPPASFSANACSEAPAPLDGDGDRDEGHYALPPVDNAAMDADHAVIADLMRAAASSRDAADLAALREEFLQHASREEALMRRTENEARGGGGGGTSLFEASVSHSADHARIAGLADTAAALASSDGQVPGASVRGVCRAILEHAATFDALYAGTLVAVA